MEKIKMKWNLIYNVKKNHKTSDWDNKNVILKSNDFKFIWYYHLNKKKEKKKRV